ncbi:MAG TPA: hypothetical protein VFU94_14020 [Conexibacter sp.]|nr:hypothetical protein [Conexibacter sp.]
MLRRRRHGRRRARTRRIAPLALLLLVCASATADASSFQGTLQISSVGKPSAASSLATVSAQASVTPQCDQTDCGWQPVVETAAVDQACAPSSGVPVWTGTAYDATAGAQPRTFSPSWHEVPAATPVGRRACLFARTSDGAETLVAQVLYLVPARPAPHGGPDPGLLRTPIPRWVAPVRRRWPFRVSTANVPPGVSPARFVALVRAAGARWGLRYAGTTRAPVRRGDGRSTVGFAHVLPRGALGLTSVEVAVYLRAGRVVARRVVEEDTRFLYRAPWDAGPALPDDRHIDLETVILHELGHYAGNGHARNCRDTPMWVALGVGEWWHSPTDWFQHGCGIATAAAHRPAATAPPGRLLVRVHEHVVTLR